MKTSVITLAEHDDELSIRDQMGWSKSARILLVWPEKGDSHWQKMELALIQRHSRELGAQLAFVCRPGNVDALASELGIAVFRSVETAQRQTWARRRARRTIWRKFSPHHGLPADPLREPRKSEGDGVLNPGMRLGVFVLCILGLGILALSLLPEATIVLTPKREQQVLNLNLRANPAIDAPNVSGVLPAVVKLVVVEAEDTTTSTGISTLPEAAATGVVQLVNLTDKPVKLLAGSILMTTSQPPVRFETIRSLDVLPGREVKASTAIRAVAGGSQGNVPAGSIQVLEGGIGLLVAVNNAEPTQGGTDRRAVAPGEADYIQLREQLMTQLRKNALDEFVKQLGPGEQILENSVDVQTILEEFRDPPEGQSGDQLRLLLRVQFAGWVIRQANLDAAVKLAMDAVLIENKSAISEPVVVRQLQSPRKNGDNLEWAVECSRGIWHYPDRVEVVRQALGQPGADLPGLLAAHWSLNQPPAVRVNPSWWPWLPLLPARIQVEVK